MKPRKLLPLAMAIILVFSVCMTGVSVYAAGVEEHGCTDDCEICNARGNDGYEDCICAFRCTEDAVNGDCAVCGMDYTRCMPAVQRRETSNKQLDISDGTITITSTGYKQGDEIQEIAYTGNYDIMQSDAGTANRIIIESGAIDMDISGLNIEAVNAPAIRVENSAVLNLKLTGENTLKGSAGYAAVSVAPGIWKDEIEGYMPETLGHLKISGEGSLKATGGNAAGSGKFGGGAGIGGDGYGDGNTEGGDFGIVDVAGGKVTAKGGGAVSLKYGAGAGIGGGGGDSLWKYAGTIIISSGNVNATGGDAYNDFCGAAAIGSGAASSNNATYGSDIKITGGVVTAYGGVDSAAIGGSANGGGGNIAITGGDITAKGGEENAQWEFGGAGIGGGDNGGGNDITIGGAAKVTATGGGAAAGIGGGNGGYYKNIVIEDQAEVTAVGGRAGGAGIGGGYSPYISGSVNAEITLNTQETVVAYGGRSSQAVGFGASPLSSKEYSITVKENSGPVWMFNTDQKQSAVNGIKTDNTVDSDALTLNNRVIWWHNGTDDISSGYAYFWDGAETLQDSVYDWSAEGNTLSIQKDGTDVASFQYGPELHDAYDNWAVVYQDVPDIKYGNLTVSRTVSDNGDYTEKVLSFTVTLGDNSINGTYGDMTFTDGVAAFTLENGEEKTATGLPAGMPYVVTVAEADQDGYITSGVNSEGVIKGGDSVAVIFTSKKGTSTNDPIEPDKPDEPDPSDRPGEADKPDPSDQPNKPDKPDPSDRPNRPDELNKPDGADKPDESNKPDEAKTGDAVPETGYEHELTMWLTLCGISLLCQIAAFIVFNKKRYGLKHK